MAVFAGRRIGLHRGRTRVVVALLMLVPACGQTAAGGAGGAPGGVGGATGGVGGTAGATGGATGGAGGSGNAPLCPGDSTLRSIGAIGDRSFVLDPEGTASSGSPQREDDWSILRAASADQALLAWEQFPIGGGTPLTAGGVVVMPGASPSSAMFYCASDAAPTSGAADAPVAVLSQLSVLGQCPGTPVSGNVVVCTAKGPAADGGAACLAFGATGAVDGADIGLGTQGGSTVRPGNTDSVFDVVASGTNQGAIVVTSAAGGSVTGWLRLPNGTDPNAGMIYCLDNGQLANRAAGVYSVTFQSISRLGQCPGTTPIAGQINLCD